MFLSKTIKELNESLLKMIDRELYAGTIVGTSIIVALQGEIIFETHAGFADREAKQPVDEHSIFRLASMTKPLVSATASALIEEGRLYLDDPLTRWLPDFKPQLANGSIPIITIRHLLTHTSGLAYGFLSPEHEALYRSAGISDGLDESPSGLSQELNLRRLGKVNLFFAPGTSWCYSLATDVLGAVLEKVCNLALPEIVTKYVTGKLGMANTTFCIDAMNQAKLVTAYADAENDMPARRMMSDDRISLGEGGGHIYFAPGKIMNPNASASGGAGMAGTARDYLKFLEAVRMGGGKILKEESVQYMIKDQVPNFEVAAVGPGYGFGMGFSVIRDSQLAMTKKNIGTFEWGGVYGNKMFVDPVQELSVVMLTNTAVYGLMGPFSSDITNTIYDYFPAQS